MNKDNFKLVKIDTDNGHRDYWFETDDVSNKILTERYREQCMRAVFQVVYSEDENIVGVERTFDWNYDVIIVDDKELKEILKEVVNNY